MKRGKTLVLHHHQSFIIIIPIKIFTHITVIVIITVIIIAGVCGQIPLFTCNCESFVLFEGIFLLHSSSPLLRSSIKIFYQTARFKTLKKQTICTIGEIFLRTSLCTGIFLIEMPLQCNDTFKRFWQTTEWLWPERGSSKVWQECHAPGREALPSEASFPTCLPT